MTIKYKMLSVAIERNPGFLVAECFLNASDCYVMTGIAEGLCYMRYGSDAEGPYCVSVNIDGGQILSAEKLLWLLDSLAAQPDADEQQVKSIIDQANLTAPVPMTISGVLTGEGMAYRTYMSTADIVDIFAYPQQEVYGPFGTLVVVDATANAIPTSGFVRINDRIERRFYIVAPEQVSASTDIAAVDTPVTLIYHSPLGDDVKVDFFAHGQSSRYATYEAPFLFIKNAVDAKIEFPHRHMRELGVTLLLDFGNGRVFNQKVDFLPTAVEYNRLRAGSFHGFKAVKLDTPHTYRIELCPVREDFTVDNGEKSNAPLTTEETPAVSAPEPTKMKMRKQRRRKSRGPIVILSIVIALVCGWALVRFMPEVIDIPSAFYDRLESDEVQYEGDVDTIAAPAIDFLPADTTPTEQVQPSQPADSAADIRADGVAASEEPVVQTSSENVADANALEQADVEYLNKHNKWNKADLKSDKYRAFYDSFGEGNIRKIAEADYFAKPGVATNAQAEKVVKFLWQAYRTPVQRSNERVLQRLAGKSSIDLDALVNELARYRDSNPNMSARPVKQ